jgi:hypothetical protein
MSSFQVLKKIVFFLCDFFISLMNHAIYESKIKEKRNSGIGLASHFLFFSDSITKQTCCSIYY